MKKFISISLALINTVTFAIGLGFLFGDDQDSEIK